AAARGPRRRRLALQPLGLRLAAGDRLRLSLAAAAWPQIAVNPGDGSLPMGPAGSGHRVITLAFALARSRLWLRP
ncbi:MAG: CocE/NonD family hydrolase C-terminal non-catalytic domain-containing protein, partial [Prochlorococcaceae cyanobacterium]